jgi:hypothetical protein
VVLLALHDGATEVLRSTDGSAWDARPVLVEGRPFSFAEDSTTWLAAGTHCLAIGAAHGVWISREVEDFRRVAATGTTAGLFTGSDPDAPLVFAEASTDAEDSARILRTTRDRRVEILADVAPPDDDRGEVPSILAMAWDEMTQTLRVAFSAVLCSVTPPRAKD